MNCYQREAAAKRALESYGRQVHRRVEPQADLLRDRDERLSAPRSLTALLMNDPPSGRSALDQKLARS